ncbi:MAG: motility associated factor glycosyltransferase family protein [Spirochaetes bacterium]|nr:motility associated factor glycosyltransferase family protein [Spirochaetota bacterium]
MIIQKNIPFLSPLLLKELQETSSCMVKFKESKDKLLVPFVNNTALHSTYYPLKEGKRLKISKDPKELCIAIGFGGGYHLVELAKLNRKIICLPVDNNILYGILKNIDLSRWFNKENFIILTEKEILNYFDFFKYKGFFFVIHPILEKLYSARVLQIIKNVGIKLRQPLLETNTQRKFGKLWFGNIIRNIIYLFENKLDFKPLSIEKKPILVTGAGPSLIENIDLIKSNISKLFIAATDTSLKVLNKFNITPDVVFSFDAQHSSYLHFTGIKTKFRLFTDFTSSLRLSNDQTILFSNHPFVNIFKKAGCTPIYLPSDTRNIGGAIIDFFCKYFPDYPIVTVGIDYGIHKNSLYSKGSYINDYMLVNRNYFLTDNNIDCSLLYRDRFLQKQGEWQTTELLLQYTKTIKDKTNIYSLSTSPFVPYKKIKLIDEVINQSKKLKAKTVSFEKPKINKLDFFSLLIQEIKSNPEFLYSYFLSIGKNPDEYEVEKLITLLKKMFFAIKE